VVKTRGGGYTLIVCVMAVTLLSIAVATALPLMSGQIKREKEAELVFRGLQYAEAIRVFQRRFGRPPTMLSELMDTRPRSIRQLWKDPMTEDGNWMLLVNSRQGGRNAADPNDQGGDIGELEEGDVEGEDPNGRGQQPVGQIIGVRSRSDKAGMRTFFESDGYASWRFTVDLLAVRPPGPDGLPIVPRAAWIGKSFRKSMQPPGTPPPPGSGLGVEPQPPQLRPPPTLGGEPVPQPPPQKPPGT
jgi:type II secretory pathway pseudopilin PulG